MVVTVNLGGILSIFTTTSSDNSVSVIQNLYVPWNELLSLTLTPIVAFPSVKVTDPLSTESILYLNSFPSAPKLAIISNITFWLVQLSEVYLLPSASLGTTVKVASSFWGTVTVTRSEILPSLSKLSTTRTLIECSPGSSNFIVAVLSSVVVVFHSLSPSIKYL